MLEKVVNQIDIYIWVKMTCLIGPQTWVILAPCVSSTEIQQMSTMFEGECEKGRTIIALSITINGKVFLVCNCFSQYHVPIVKLAYFVMKLQSRVVYPAKSTYLYFLFQKNCLLFIRNKHQMHNTLGKILENTTIYLLSLLWV